MFSRSCGVSRRDEMMRPASSCASTAWARWGICVRSPQGAHSRRGRAKGGGRGNMPVQVAMARYLRVDPSWRSAEEELQLNQRAPMSADCSSRCHSLLFLQPTPAHFRHSKRASACQPNPDAGGGEAQTYACGCSFSFDWSESSSKIRLHSLAAYS